MAWSGSVPTPAEARDRLAPPGRNPARRGGVLALFRSDVLGSGSSVPTRARRASHGPARASPARRRGCDRVPRRCLRLGGRCAAGDRVAAGCRRPGDPPRPRPRQRARPAGRPRGRLRRPVHPPRHATDRDRLRRRPDHQPGARHDGVSGSPRATPPGPERRRRRRQGDPGRGGGRRPHRQPTRPIRRSASPTRRTPCSWSSRTGRGSRPASAPWPRPWECPAARARPSRRERRRPSSWPASPIPTDTFGAPAAPTTLYAPTAFQVWVSPGAPAGLRPGPHAGAGRVAARDLRSRRSGRRRRRTPASPARASASWPVPTRRRSGRSSPAANALTPFTSGGSDVLAARAAAPARRGAGG